MPQNKDDYEHELRMKIGELIIHNQEFDLERKQMYETKAAAYIAIVVFILTIEVQYLSMVFCAADKEIFIFKQLFSSCCCKNLFFSLSLVVSLITFVIGIVLLVVCVFSLLARKVRVMGQDKLANCYHADSKNIDYAWECIIDGSIKAGIITEECNERLETFIKVASVLLSVIIYSFILSSIFVFFMRILYIGVCIK